MDTQQNIINRFLDFWNHKSTRPANMLPNAKLLGADCILTTIDSYNIALKVKSYPTLEDIGLFQALHHHLASHGFHLVVLSIDVSDTIFQRMMMKQLNIFVSPEKASIALPNFTYVYCMVKRPSQQRSLPTEHTVFVGRASRLCRLFLANPNKVWQQSELVQTSGLNKGYVSILMKKLVEEQYIQQIGYNYSIIDFNHFLDDWVRVYHFSRFKASQQYAVAGRNYGEYVMKVADIMLSRNTQFAFTGWTAAAIRAAYMEPPLVMAYVSELPKDTTSLFPVESKGNVFLAVPSDMGRLQEFQTVDGLPLVCDVQAYLDLSKMPGRAIDQAAHYREKLLA